MKRILVLTDFSPCAEHAAITAINIASKLGAQINFLHYKSVPPNWVHLSDFEGVLYHDIDHHIKEITAQMKELVRKAEQNSIQAMYNIAYDEDLFSLLNYIHKQHIDFVIMGSEEAHGMKELFIGSNAQVVARHADVPVLILKKPINEIEHPHVFYFSDFDEELLPSFKRLMEFIEPLQATIDLIFVNTPGNFIETDEMEARMHRFRKEGGDMVLHLEITSANNFERGLEKYCQHCSDGIVAMTTHGRKGIARWLGGSLTESVINHTKHPVLAVHV